MLRALGLLRLLLLPYTLYRSLTGRGRATFDLELWAEERGMDVFDLEPHGHSKISVSSCVVPACWWRAWAAW